MIREKEIDMLINQLEYRNYIQQDYRNMIAYYLRRYKELYYQLEEKNKIINGVSGRIKVLGKYNGEICTRGFSMMPAEFNYLLGILERGKNGK